ncbi:hypothetical protein M407DRAFT_28135 [Tulasnella calospora MUT 4182]|uniref:Extracellular membrane protein CFEM domain-containing protein n=1 Tax=Tulasnella calospora MUT 4182 TaxID=1051891 RepID=A0A0C3Q1Z8_9AGAM|nr:hypothetical protein M407DRAFT_28135 [Tulasnella calospora MUT 4182]
MKLSVLVSAVAAFAVASAAVVPKSDLFALTRRQTSDDCAFYCHSMSDMLNECDKVAKCMCSPPAASLIYTCATCDVKTGSDTFSDAQSILISYASACAQADYPVGALALSAC